MQARHRTGDRPVRQRVVAERTEIVVLDVGERLVDRGVLRAGDERIA